MPIKINLNKENVRNFKTSLTEMKTTFDGLISWTGMRKETVNLKIC